MISFVKRGDGGPRMARPGWSRCSASRLHFPFLPPSGGVVGYSELCLERPFFAVYGQQVSDEFARYGQCSPVAISFLFLALVNQRQVRVPAQCSPVAISFLFLALVNQRQVRVPARR